MNQKEKNFEKVKRTIKGTKFLGLSVVSIDIETLESALIHQYEEGYEEGIIHGYVM